MKYRTVVLTAIFAMMPFAVGATGEHGHHHGYHGGGGENENTNVNVNNNSPSSFSLSSSSSQSFAASSSSSSSNSSVDAAISGTNALSVGNISTSGGVSAQAIVEAPLIPAMAPGIPQISTGTPQLYRPAGVPANAAAMAMTLEYLKACSPRYRAGKRIESVAEKGASGLTRITFNPHYGADTRNPVKEVVVAMPPDASFTGRYVCLGIMKVEALPKESSTAHLQTIMDDAGQFGAENIRGGYDEVYLITVPGVLTANMGVEGTGRGWGLAPAVGDIVGGNGFLGLGASLGRSGGITLPVAQLGATFAVLAKPREGEKGVNVPVGAFLGKNTSSP